MYAFYVPAIVPFYQSLYFTVRIVSDSFLFSNFGRDHLLKTPHYSVHTNNNPFKTLTIRVTKPNSNTNTWPMIHNVPFQNATVQYYQKQYPIAQPLFGIVKKYQIQLKKAEDLIFYENRRNRISEEEFIQELKPTEEITEEELINQLN